MSVYFPYLERMDGRFRCSGGPLSQALPGPAGTSRSQRSPAGRGWRFLLWGGRSGQFQAKRLGGDATPAGAVVVRICLEALPVAGFLEFLVLPGHP